MATNTDSVAEGPETVIATLGTPSGAPVGAPAITVTGGAATGNITDTTALTVSIANAPTINEGGSLVYTVTLSGTSTTDITIPLTYGGTGTPVLDFNGQPVSVTILAGQTTATVTVPTLADSIEIGRAHV